jgi:hypothetical protein
MDRGQQLMKDQGQATQPEGQDPPGIVIRDGGAPPVVPAIAAFIWGGKVRPLPTLPYGRWKASAA